MKRRYSVWHTTLIWLVVIVVMGFFLRPNRAVQVQVDDEGLVLTSASGYTINVRYDEIGGAEYREDFDYGSPIDGTDDNQEKSGLWENSELGRYRMCVNAKVAPCIVLTTDEGVLVINYESAKSTQSLYNALLERIANNEQ